MELIEAIKSRKSTRAYRSDPVPRKILEQALEVARWAPSADNSQPWEVAIVSGKPLAELKQILSEKMSVMEEFKPDIPFPFPNYPPLYTNRGKENGRRLFECMGIPRGDMEKRLQWVQRMICFFDAPAAMILYVERALGDYAILDAGMFLQNFILTCTKHGLGTCVEMGVVFYPQVLRNMLNIPESKLIICGLAIGYPDENAPVNKFRSLREPIESFANWHGFD
jgi:nitroreductase